MTVTSHLSTDGGFVLAANQELEMFEHSAAGAHEQTRRGRGWDCHNTNICISIDPTLCRHLIDQIIVNKQEFLTQSHFSVAENAEGRNVQSWMRPWRKSPNKILFPFVLFYIIIQRIKKGWVMGEAERQNSFFPSDFSPPTRLPPAGIWMGFFGLHWYSECTFLSHIFIHMKTWRTVLYSKSGFSAWLVQFQRMLLKYNLGEE